MTTSLQDLQYLIDYKIFGALLACLPLTWTRAKLTAVEEREEGAGSRMSVSIDSVGQPGIALVSDELQDAVRELFLLNKRFNTGLREIAYTYNCNDNGKWLFNGEYDYGSKG